MCLVIISSISCLKTTDNFTGLAGVYHIGDHFQHESSRGVEDVSCMTRAMRGQENFDKVSPTHLLSLVQEPGSVK